MVILHDVSNIDLKSHLNSIRQEQKVFSARFGKVGIRRQVCNVVWVFTSDVEFPAKRKNRFAKNFLNHFASFSPAKNAKISRKKNTKKIERNLILFIKHLYGVKEEKLFQILSYQSREFNKFV